MNPHPESPPSSSKRSRTWLWVVAAFAIQATVWAIWINLAAKNPVQEVPLAHRR